MKQVTNKSFNKTLKTEQLLTNKRKKLKRIEINKKMHQKTQ